MAPLARLLEAATERHAELEAQISALQSEIDEVDICVKAKNGEKTIAAMDEVKELRKRRDGFLQKSRLLVSAAGHVKRAIEKLERTSAAGLEDHTDLHEVHLPLSDFAVKRLQDADVLDGLRQSCGGATLAIDCDKLSYCGSAKAMPALRSALEALENEFVLTLDVESVLLSILETHGTLRHLGEKHGVTIVRQGTDACNISGPEDGARKADKSLRFLLSGRADLACAKNMVGPAKVQAKEAEANTGALIEVERGGPSGTGLIRIRGDVEAVREAEQQLQEWLDEREGAYSVYIDVSKILDGMTPDKRQQFNGDLGMFAGKFRISIFLEPAGTSGRLELRGAKDGGWEQPARSELNQLMDFYTPAPKVKPKAKPKGKPKVEEDDMWGAAAPEADFDLGHKWKK